MGEVVEAAKTVVAIVEVVEAAKTVAAIVEVAEAAKTVAAIVEVVEAAQTVAHAIMICQSQRLFVVEIALLKEILDKHQVVMAAKVNHQVEVAAKTEAHATMIQRPQRLSVVEVAHPHLHLHPEEVAEEDLHATTIPALTKWPVLSF